MAEFASSLINSLASLAMTEFARINDLEDELKRLNDRVQYISDVLLHLDGKQEQSDIEQKTVKRLKDVLIPADNLLDKFAIQEMINKRDETRQNKLKKALDPSNLSKKSSMAREIEKLQKTIDEVLNDISRLNINPNVWVVEKTNNEWRETDSYVLEKEIIGRDDDKDEILSLLRQPHRDQNVSFVAIVGIGGLGKTALAKLVYNDQEVEDLFEKRMWISVCENFDVKTILNKMLLSLTKNKPEDTSPLDYLQDKLRESLAGKRYFLVLDDVWNHSLENWPRLRDYLMCGAQGSKVVVTTRDTSVAHKMGVKDPYVLSGLTIEKSWSLLKKTAFGDDIVTVDQNIESIGKKIAEKCKGIPLAIRSLGSTLDSKSEEKEWKDVLRGDFWKSCEDKNSILPVLKLSYNYLSPQQRQCFAYCSLFPKDWKFEKDELIQMWMAHGYLGCLVEEKSMEDVGNQFVNTFLMKSFFHEAKLNEDGDIIGFKMHDLMHDLAKQVAGDNCCYLDNNAKELLRKPLHVWVEFDAFYLLKSLDSSRLRTLIVFSSNFNDLLDREKQSIISTFKYLRVLKLCNFEDVRLCVSFEKLKHLRFLDLLESCIPESLLKSIGNHICLQTIKVSLDEKVVLSTKVVSKLINLRHLKIKTWTFRDKTRPVGNFFGWLSPLKHIIEITLTDCQGFQYLPPLERLPFLKSLQLCDLDDLEYIYCEELIHHEPFFPSLKTLDIRNCRKLVGWKKMGDDFNDINHLLLPQFPCLSFLVISECSMLTHMPTCPNIKKLSLQVKWASKMNIANLPQYWWQNLTFLENLEFVYLSSEHFEAIEIWFKEDINYFPSLQKITFKCDDLKALPDWICNISSLQHIKIENCRDLALLPEGMTHLTNLHTLEILRCPLLIEECEKETSATLPRIAHIPNIIKIPDPIILPFSIPPYCYYSSSYLPYHLAASIEENPNACVIA